MALSAAVNQTKGKVEIQKMRRLRPKVDTHFFNTTLAKRTRVWIRPKFVQMINKEEISSLSA
jgi:hypothetical protein